MPRMHIIIVGLVTALFANPAAAECFTPNRLTVVDGDTVKIPGHQLVIGGKVLSLGTKGELRVRLEGIDAPETMKQFADCPEEVALGMQAKAELQSLTDGRLVELCTEGKTDRYARLIARLYVYNPTRQNVQVLLVERGLAKVWTGSKGDWCGE